MMNSIYTTGDALPPLTTLFTPLSVTVLGPVYT